MPRTNNQARANIRTIVPMNPIPNNANHSSGVFRVRTIPLIFSVIVV
jgi:hypothetical protein